MRAKVARLSKSALDDAEWHWGTFVQFDPNAFLQMTFHMGLPEDKTGLVDVRFTPISATETQVELTHHNREGYEDMAEMMYQGYGGSWDLLFVEHFGAACGG